LSIERLQGLEMRLHEPLPVHERVRLLNEISEELYEREPTRGAALAREALELARAMHDAPEEAQALYCLGRNLYSQADYPGVFETQNAALALFRTLGNAGGEARCSNLLGITYKQLAEYGPALEMYELALKGFRETADLKWQARVLSNVGNVEIQLGNFGVALELFEQALELRREVGDTEGAGFDLNNAAFGRIQRALQLRAAGDKASCQLEAEDALRLLDRALALARQFGYKRLEAFCLQTMGEAYQAMSRPEVALGMADEFLQLARDCNDKWIEAYGLACVGEVRHQLGQHAEAIALLATALESFQALGSRDETARVLRILSQAHEADGNLNDALSCLRRSGAIEQRLKNEETERRSRALSARRRLEQVTQEAERYRRLAMEDSLTGLANRRQLDERLAALMREAELRGSVLTVALADVDHFKGINDRFSHAVGDEVLRCVGEILRGQCRLGDMAGRFGGEEFMLIFRGLDIRAAAEACERVRRAVESWDWQSIHPQLRVTLSLGLASNISFEHPQGLLDAADHWLYEAKHHGRNQVQPLVLAPTGDVAPA
jgi:diguanylate cyclase (GGDEF)-like protein